MDCEPPLIVVRSIITSAFAGEETLPGQRRSLREKNFKNLKDASSSDEDGDDDGMLLFVFSMKTFNFQLRNSLNVIIQRGFIC